MFLTWTVEWRRCSLLYVKLLCPCMRTGGSLLTAHVLGAHTWRGRGAGSCDEEALRTELLSLPLSWKSHNTPRLFIWRPSREESLQREGGWDARMHVTSFPPFHSGWVWNLSIGSCGFLKATGVSGVSEQCAPRPSVRRPRIVSETMRAGETRPVPCWTTPRACCWLWPRWPDSSSDARAGATRTCSCRPSTPPTGSWPTWRWTCASPRGAWRRATPRPTPPPPPRPRCRACPSATWASSGCCPPRWWPAGTAASASSVTCSSTPPTTTAGRSSPPPSTGPSRPSSWSTSGSPGVSRSCGCAWAAGCPGTGGSVRAGRGASRAGTRSPSAAWISASTSWRGTKVGGWTENPSSRHLWLVSWLWWSSCGVLLLSYGRCPSLQGFCPTAWSRGDPDNWNDISIDYSLCCLYYNCSHSTLHTFGGFWELFWWDAFLWVFFTKPPPL